MKRELKESFEIRVAGTEDWYSMTVPGSAMDTLVKAGVLPDPYYGENEYQVRFSATILTSGVILP